MLIEYYFKIQYTKGIENTRADALSKKAKLQNNKKLLGAMLRKDKNRLIRYNYPKIISDLVNRDISIVRGSRKPI